MKKRITKILCLILAVMLTLTGFTGCKKKHTAEGRDVYQGGDGMFDNKLTIFRWNFSGLNSARKKNSPVYKVLKENSKYSLLKINVETGRKNQIRVQLENIGHPIVGDNKYGEQEGIKKWIDRNKKWGNIMQEKRMESGHIGSAYSQSSK